jgi:hypothetical protein
MALGNKLMARNGSADPRRSPAHGTVSLLAMVLVIALWPMVSFANPCVGPKTTPVFGTMRGVVLDPSGARVPNAIIRLNSPTGPDHAEIHSDAEGQFESRFSSWRKGADLLTTRSPGWRSDAAELEATGWRPTIWKRPLLVEYEFRSCQGGISRGNTYRGPELAGVQNAEEYRIT